MDEFQKYFPGATPIDNPVDKEFASTFPGLTPIQKADVGDTASLGGLDVPLEDRRLDENINSWARNLFAGLHQIDRPRIAQEWGALNVIEELGRGNLNVASSYAEGVSKGWEAGKEGKSLVGANYWFEMFDKAKKHPEEYPGLSLLYGGLSTAYNGITGGFWGKPNSFRRVIGSGVSDAPEVHGAVSSFLGLATDIFMDPTSYVGVGLATKAAEGYKAGAGALAKLMPGAATRAESLKAASKSVIDGFMQTQLVDTTFRLFSDKYGLTSNPEFNKLYEQFKLATKLSRGKAVKDNKVLQGEIKTLADNVGAPYEDVSRFVTQAVEIPESWDTSVLLQLDVPNLPPKIREAIAQDEGVQRVIGTLKFRQKMQFEEEIAHGAKYTPLGLADRKLAERYEKAFDAAAKKGQTDIRDPATGYLTSVETAKKHYDELVKTIAGRDDIDYFIHAATPEFRKAAITRQRGEVPGEARIREVSERTASQLQRRLNEQGIQTIAQINELARTGKLPGYEGVKFANGAFIEDVALAQAIRDLRHNRLISALDFHREAASQFGTGLKDLHEIAAQHIPGFNKRLGFYKTLDELKKLDPAVVKQIQDMHGINIHDIRTLENPATRGMVGDFAFPSEIANRLDAYVNIILDPDKRNWFGKSWDYVGALWKAGVTSVWPSFHVRNNVTNFLNNFIAGVDLRAYKDAVTFQKIKNEADLIASKRYTSMPESLANKQLSAVPIRSYDGVIITKQQAGLTGSGPLTYADVHAHMDKLGVRGKGFMGADMEQQFTREFLQSGRANPLSLNWAGYEYGRQIGEKSEDFFRVANFVDGLRKGMSFDDSAKRVTSTLFDYTTLTDAEKKWGRRIVPFYAWWRKNIPFQLENMVKHPGKYKVVDTVRQNIEASHGEGRISDHDFLLANYFMDNYPVQFRVNDKGNPEYFTLGGWHAGVDVWKMASSLGDDGGMSMMSEMIHPVAKGLMETVYYPFLTGDEPDGPKVKDLYTGREYITDENVDYMGMRISPRLKQWMKNIRLFNEVDKFMQAYSEGEYPSKSIYSPQAETYTPARALVSFLLGVKTFEADMSKMIQSNAFAANKEKTEGEKAIRRSITKQYPQEEVQQQVDDALNFMRRFKGE